MNRTEVTTLLTYWKGVLEKYQAAYVALIEGGAKYYMIDDRQLTKFDLDEVRKGLEDAEAKVSKYQAMLDGKRARKAFAIVPRDF